MEWGALFVAVTAIAAMWLDKTFAERRLKAEREARRTAEAEARRRPLYIRWLSLTFATAELLTDYIAQPPNQGNFLKSEFNKRVTELMEQLLVEAPPEVFAAIVAQRNAVMDALHLAYKEAGAAPRTPGFEFTLTFDSALRKRTERERLATINAIRKDLGHDSIPFELTTP